MKLISLNIEGLRHTDKVEDFIKKEDADVVCLMECPEMYVSTIKALGYHTTYANNRLVNRTGEETLEGNLMATKVPHTAESYYYYKTEEPLALEKYDDVLEHHNTHKCIILASFEHNQERYSIGTTHFTWTPQGEHPNKGQIQDMDIFLKYVRNLPPHVMCGDFNIPRHHSPLYKDLVSVYTDEIPKNYKTSLDKELHRRGGDSSRAHLFTDFMVDYLFAQYPYRAENVRLVFGVSDHAAVVADIVKK